MEKKSNPSTILSPDTKNQSTFSRKRFLKVCGLSAGAAIMANSCTEVPNAVMETGRLQIQPDPYPNNGKIWIGSKDIALLNTMHIFSRLVEAFYKHVLENPYSNMSLKEKTIITAIKDHEIIHSKFWAALLDDSAIYNIHFNFNSFNFNNRNEVLSAAFLYENYSVSMFNNFPPILVRNSLFQAFTKVGSVEARHAVALGFLLTPEKAFIINEAGVDAQNSPQAAWNFFHKFIHEDFDIQGLPRY